MTELEREQRALEREIDAEAARLIRGGMASGWEARRIARGNIMEKRRRSPRPSPETTGPAE